MRSTFGTNIVNEARIGWAGGFGKGTLWYPNAAIDDFSCSGFGCQNVGGQGYALGISSAASGITNAYTTYSPSARNTPSSVYEDTLTWLKGLHTVSMGATVTRVTGSNWADTHVPYIGFGMTSLDPAYSMLLPASGNFPGGISSTWAGYARNLYSVLTGRVTSHEGSAWQDVDGQYIYLGDRTQTAAQNELGLFISDSWRLRPNLTLTGGLRYELQFPYTSDTIAYARLEDPSMLYGITGKSGMFTPGATAGTAPSLVQYEKGDRGYKMDINNIAPSIGVAWRANLGQSWLSKIVGREPVIRGGYAISYSRLGTNLLTGTYGTNPGLSRTATRTTTSGTPRIGYDWFPVLLRETTRLFPGYARRADLSVQPRHQREHRRARADLHRPVYAPVEHRLAARAREYDGGRGTLRRQPERGRVDDLEHQRPGELELPRERLLRRVPQGAGEPAGQRRRGPVAHLRLHGEAGHLAAADLRVPRGIPLNDREPGSAHYTPTSAVSGTTSLMRTLEPRDEPDFRHCELRHKRTAELHL
jgi:hypothetical protein